MTDHGEGNPQDLALALSGGGHRATLFGLGALLYLTDAGQGPRLGSIASISGGSLANGYIGLHCDLTTASPEEVRGHARTLAHQVARKGTLWAGPWTWAFCALVVLLPIVAASLTWLRGAAWGWLIWAAVLVVDGWLAQQRSWVGRRAFERTLFRRARLDAVHSKVDHVICATDIQVHELVYFSSRFVTSWRWGWGRPGDLRLAHAVQASAALPFAFSAVRIPVSRFGLRAPRPVLRSFLLVDGGVYDNMGDQWGQRASGPHWGDDAPVRPPHQARALIVANASAAKVVTPRRLARWPLIGEVVTLLADKDVLYDQTTAPRRQLLALRFRVAGRPDPPPGQDLDGTLVQIAASPYDLPDSFRRGGDDRAQRARAAIAALDAAGGPDRDWWSKEAAINSRVKTALSKVPTERAASLMLQAYVITMVNAHVLLDLPLLPIPTLDDMAALVG
jgi:hypothetical protein